MKRAGRGVIEVNSDFGPGEFEVLRAAAEVASRPLSVLLLQVNNAPRAVARNAGEDPRRRAKPGSECERPGRLPSDRPDLGPGDVDESVLHPSGLDRAEPPVAGRNVTIG